MKFKVIIELLAIFLIIIFSVVLGDLLSNKSTNLVSSELFTFGNIENVSCKSDSMGLTIPCGRSVITNLVSEEERVFEGKIYIYEKDENHTIIHRLIKCLDLNCSRVIFKGDNNLIADDIVNRSQIKREVAYIIP